MSENAKKFVAPKEAARIIGTSLDWITRARAKKGNGPPFYKIGGRVKYEEGELNDWLIGRRRT